MATRLGVDVGGTFTDLVYYDEDTGEVEVGKGSTTPRAPDEGVGQVIDEALAPESVCSAALFLHGTTVGINALLERKGALVGLLTTAGFRDTLEIRRGERDEMYNICWKVPPALVPRRLRVPIRERILVDGSVDVPFHEDDVQRAAELFSQEGVEAVAIAFINGYLHSKHERLAETVLRESGFKGAVSLSHQISGEYREYERTSTTVVDAYVRPRLSVYLQRLEGTLRDRGFIGDLLITSSGGGALGFAEASRRPFETIMSGPVAGAVGAAEICRGMGIGQAITADVGGTSFDTCLVVDGRPQLKFEGSVAGMPLQTPWIDVRSIGAGGGSLAEVDEGGLLRVGPESAGADPGPACYGRGGTAPTVTDAAAALGMLARGRLAGDLQLDLEAARKSLESIGTRLGIDVERVARGIVQIAAAHMADAIRSVTIEQGHDPRAGHLVAFGGAGPLFATLLAQELEISVAVIPQHAGNFSAWGLLGQDIVRSAAQTRIRRLSAEGLAEAAETFKALIGRLIAQRGGRSNDDGSGVTEAYLDLRYVGQEYTLTVPVPVEGRRFAADPTAIRSTFEEDYDRTFGHILEGEVEIVCVRASERTVLPRASQGIIGGSSDLVRPTSYELDVFSFNQGRRVPFRVLERSALTQTEPVDGPVIVLEDTATTYVDSGFRLLVDEAGTLVLRSLSFSLGEDG